MIFGRKYDRIITIQLLCRIHAGERPDQEQFCVDAGLYTCPGVLRYQYKKQHDFIHKLNQEEIRE